MRVEVKNGDVDAALRKLKKALWKDGILAEYKNRALGYEKPSVKKRRKKKEALLRSRREARERNNF